MNPCDAAQTMFSGGGAGRPGHGGDDGVRERVTVGVHRRLVVYPPPLTWQRPEPWRVTLVVDGR